MVRNLVMKGIFVGGFVLMAAGLASAQSFTKINPPPCDFSDQFYKVNGILTQDTTTPPPGQTAELATEPAGRFGTFRKTGPPATGTQVNWVADTTDCSATDPSRRDFRILATTAGNADDGNSPFTCADPNFAGPSCAGQPAIPETPEFISILAFLHKLDTSFEDSFTVNEGDNTISITPGTAADGVASGLNARSIPSQPGTGISMEYIVSNFEAYASVSQFVNVNGVRTFAPGPCSAQMNAPNPVPTPCFPVADTKDANGNTISDVATPRLRQNWRFATNRNALDGSDNNCITQNDQSCKHKGSFNDTPFGYFCDDLLGMWIITYFWFTQPPDTAVEPCKDIFAAIGAKNGFNLDGTPVILTAHELNDELEFNGCGAEGKEAFDGSDGGAVWLVCPAIPDSRNGAITPDAFLDVVTHSSLLDPFLSNNFTCLQQNGKFCFETSVE